MGSRRSFRSCFVPQVRGRNDDAGTDDVGRVRVRHRAGDVQLASRNYPRLADWTASAHRLASLLLSLDRPEDAESSETSGRIMRRRAEDGALRLRDVCVTLNDGNAVVNEADIEIRPGEKVLVVGESGTGKSMLVRAIAGLWPWGKGENPGREYRVVPDAAAAVRAPRYAAACGHLSAFDRWLRRPGGAEDDRRGGPRSLPRPAR
jgi:putative ATP-binding cassette transporter